MVDMRVRIGTRELKNPAMPGSGTFVEGLDRVMDLNRRGLAGPAAKPVILRMACQVAQAVRIPVTGCGGISTARDAIACMMVGASAVQVGIANFTHPTAMLDIIAGIEDFCRRKGPARASDLAGALNVAGRQPKVQVA